MFDELRRHPLAYIVLALLLTIHVSFFLVLWPSTMSLRVIASSFAVSYFCWGVFAHVKANHINSKIIREYFFSALLAGAMLFFLT